MNMPSYIRLRGLIKKEFLQIIRDPSSLAIAFVLPIFLLLLFGYGVSLDAKDIRIGFVVEQSSAQTQSFIAAFRQSHYFRVQPYVSMPDAVQAMKRKKISAIIRLKHNFSRDVFKPQSGQIQVIIDGVDANTARLTSGYIQGAWNNWMTKLGHVQGHNPAKAVELASRIWFNPAANSRYFLVPGLIAIIMTLIGALLTALVMAREWERGTMESLLSTPVTMKEILIAKLFPYYCLGIGGMGLSIIMARMLFAVPLHGSLWLLLLCGSLFLLVALGMGLLISSIARNQFVAGQVAIIVTFLPAFILSGFIFDIGSMPDAISMVTYLIAARYFVAILQTLFLAGNIWIVIIPNALALLAMMLFFFFMAAKKSPRTLE